MDLKSLRADFIWFVQHMKGKATDLQEQAAVLLCWKDGVQDYEFRCAGDPEHFHNNKHESDPPGQIQSPQYALPNSGYFSRAVDLSFDIRPPEPAVSRLDHYPRYASRTTTDSRWRETPLYQPALPLSGAMQAHASDTQSIDKASNNPVQRNSVESNSRFKYPTKARWLPMAWRRDQ